MTSELKVATTLSGGELLKVILLGDSGVGKSSLCRRATLDDFNESMNTATVGIDFQLVSRKIHDKKESFRLQYEFWDTSGQERYETIIAAYYKRVNFGLICFDPTDSKTMDRAFGYWLQEARKKLPIGAQVVMVACKHDLAIDRQHAACLNAARKRCEAENLQLLTTSAVTDSKQTVLEKIDTVFCRGLQNQNIQLKFYEKQTKRKEHIGAEQLAAAENNPASYGCC